jgi:Elongation factor P (EF-P) KOW-like domain
VIVASKLREEMALRIDKQIYKVLEAEFKAGAGQAGGMLKTKLRNAASGGPERGGEGSDVHSGLRTCIYRDVGCYAVEGISCRALAAVKQQTPPLDLPL